MNAALLLIDIQNDYFPGGAMGLTGMTQAAAQAREVLTACRQAASNSRALTAAWLMPANSMAPPGK